MGRRPKLEPGTKATPFALSLFDAMPDAPKTGRDTPRRTAAAKPEQKESPSGAFPPVEGPRRCLTVDGQPFFVFAPLVGFGAGGRPRGSI